MRAALALVLAAAALIGGRAASGAATWPNDPAWSQEWGPVLTHTTDVWQTAGTGTRPVIVAVVDTGVQEIPDLQGALVPGVDLAGTPPNGPLANHGTWVASIIAARGNNGRDAAGYCWTCLIMPVRVSDGGSPTSATTIAKGIVWAVDHGAQIVNVSLAGSETSSDEQSAVAYAVAHHVIVVAAAGNSGSVAPEYPADYPSVLSVSGTDQTDQLYPWSTRGSWVALSAPGCAVVVDPIVGTAYGCGSSFAPAAVTGIAGLLLSLSSTLTTDQVVAALRASALPVAGIGGGRVRRSRSARRTSPPRCGARVVVVAVPDYDGDDCGGVNSAGDRGERSSAEPQVDSGAYRHRAARAAVHLVGGRVVSDADEGGPRHRRQLRGRQGRALAHGTRGEGAAHARDLVLDEPIDSVHASDRDVAAVRLTAASRLAPKSAVIPFAAAHTIASAREWMSSFL